MKKLLHFLLVVLAFESIAAQKQKNLVEVCGLDMVKSTKDVEKGMSDAEKTEREEKITGDDIIRTPEKMKAKPGKEKGKEKRAVKTGTTKYWPIDKPIYYSLDTKIKTAALIDNIKAAIQVFEDYTCIKFEKVEKSNKEKFHINFGEAPRANSFIGMQEGGIFPYQWVNLVKKMKVGEVLHEVMHAFGFIHEQERPDRDKYINIHWENIEEGKEKNFEKEEEANTYGEEYDFNSIMHYKGNFFGTPTRKFGFVIKKKTITAKDAYGGVDRVIGAGESLTDSDIRRLNKLFMCAEVKDDQMKLAKAVIESKKAEELVEESKEKDIVNGPCEKEKQLHKND